MSNVEELVHEARALAGDVVRQAAALLLAGADIGRIQRHYIASTVRLLEEVELRAVLAETGDQDALATLERLVAGFAALQDELRAEFPDQPDEEPGA